VWHVVSVYIQQCSVYVNTAIEINVLDYSVTLRYRTATYGTVHSVNGAEVALHILTQTVIDGEMLAVCRHRLSSGTSEKIQLSSLIAAFQVARDLVAMEAE